MVSGITRLVTGVTANAIGRNVSVLTVDSLTYSVTKRATATLTNAMGPYLTKAIWEDATPRIYKAVTSVLKQIVPDKISIHIPQALERSLPMVLGTKLIRSVTHALVPALTLSLSHNIRQTQVCEMCFHNNAYCSRCHYSTESLYLVNYYSSKSVVVFALRLIATVQHTTASILANIMENTTLRRWLSWTICNTNWTQEQTE